MFHSRYGFVSISFLIADSPKRVHNSHQFLQTSESNGVTGRRLIMKLKKLGAFAATGAMALALALTGCGS
ncbi:hypothetical protein L0P44_15085, partial [Streptococcus gordonii]|nr:hypothetical protein [Streptococcus gordonii]